MSNLPAVMESMNKANDALLTLAENPKKLEQTKLLFLSAIKANEKLAKCTPESLIACLRDVTQYNLDLTKNSVNLVPYGGKATLILGYKGYEQCVAALKASKGMLFLRMTSLKLIWLLVLLLNISLAMIDQNSKLCMLTHQWKMAKTTPSIYLKNKSAKREVNLNPIVTGGKKATRGWL